MSRRRQFHRTAPIRSFVRAIHSETLWPGVALMAAGACGTVLAHLIATWAGSPSSGRSVAVTATVVMASLVALGIGAEVVVTSERSTVRHVFVSDALRRTANALVAMSVALVLTFLWLGCFGDLLAWSRVTARVVAGIGMLGAAVALVVVAGAARWLARVAGTGEDQWW